MNNKIIIKAIIPSIDKEYDIKIPVNELVWRVNKLIVKAIFDMNNIAYNIKEDNFVMINKITGKIYNNNDIIIDTDIRNASEVIFIREIEMM